ncbi:GxxExxY protein [Nostoc sp. CCY0012]|uniref:GxxExxY protein n=1 Tax=Nostoc sp. CCY0012 TaxID=1056123 RepID=UPI0039C70DCB
METNHEGTKVTKVEEKRMRYFGDELERLAYAVIGAAIEVHRVLGPGFLEEVYHKALKQEFIMRGIPYKSKYPVAVEYKGYPVGEGQLDFLIGNLLIVELKAVQNLAPIHEAQVLSYLKMTKRPLGLLINFNVPLLRDGIKRIILVS